MEIDAMIAAASRTNQSINNKLGNCSRTLHMGFFFDGVGRNIEQDALEARLSNIARLLRAFPTPEKSTTTETFVRYYISGLGTQFKDEIAEFFQSKMDKALDDYQGGLPTDPKDAAKDFAQDALSGKNPKDTLTEMKNKLLSPADRLK